MFREMRRKKKEMDRSLAESLLEKSRRGVLAVNGDDGYPYAIPVNYYYDRENQKIYFHGASEGHKADALRRRFIISICAFSCLRFMYMNHSMSINTSISMIALAVR